MLINHHFSFNSSSASSRATTLCSKVLRITAGSNAALGKGFIMMGGNGSFVVTGSDASFIHNRSITATPGTYAITGTTATLGSSRKLTASGTTYSVTGSDSSFIYNRVMPADLATYAITGEVASLELERRLASGSGTYEISGTDATLDYQAGITLSAEAGQFLIAGTSTRVTFDHIPLVEGREYYIDSNGDYYIVLSQEAGLLERV